MIFGQKDKIYFMCGVKVLFCSLVFVALSEKLYSQRESKNDIIMGYGVVTSNQVFDVATDILTSVILPVGYSTSNTQFSGGFSVNYRYFLSEHWNAGLIFNYDKVTKTVHKLNDKLGDLNRYYYTIAGEIDLRYFKKELFQMYSLVGLGYTTIRDRYMPIVEEKASKDTSGYVNFQISLLGFRIGKELAFYTELGFGYKGLVNWGFSYQF